MTNRPDSWRREARFGTVPEPVAGRSSTWVVPWNWDTARIPELLPAVREERLFARRCTVSSQRDLNDFYRVEYLSQGRRV
jgi:hypothetical protein